MYLKKQNKILKGGKRVFTAINFIKKNKIDA